MTDSCTRTQAAALASRLEKGIAIVVVEKEFDPHNLHFAYTCRDNRLSAIDRAVIVAALRRYPNRRNKDASATNKGP